MKFRTDHGAKHVADTQNTADVHTQTSHSFIGCSNTAQAIVALNKRISIYTLTGAAQDSTTELIINSIMIRAFADNVYGSNRAITVYLPDVSQFSVPFYTNL